MAKRKPLFACQECGKQFYTVKSAERASFGERGCPKCGGADIDIYVEPDAPRRGRLYSDCDSDTVVLP